MATITPFQTLIPQFHPSLQSKPPPILSLHRHRLNLPQQRSCDFLLIRHELSLLRCNTNLNMSSKRNLRQFGSDEESDNGFLGKEVTQVGLWVMEAVYILWLFLLLLLRVVGIHAVEAPVLHLMSEGLFNFVIGWTLMFAPLLYTDLRNDRYKGSLDVLWGFQMFLTNTFLIPYMAIRLNKADGEDYPRKPSQLGTVMVQGANIVGLIGGIVCLISILWGLFGRVDGDFGNVSQRWDLLLNYLGSERLAYAFIWDIVLYTIFQPWLIGDNLVNVPEDRVAIVNYLRVVPVVGLVAYLCLNRDDKVLRNILRSLIDVEYSRAYTEH